MSCGREDEANRGAHAWQRRFQACVYSTHTNGTRESLPSFRSLPMAWVLKAFVACEYHGWYIDIHD